MMPIEKQENASSILRLDSSPAHQHNRWTSHLQLCSAMQKTTTSWTGGEVGTVNPARRIVDSATAPVTAPATEECHRKPVENCRQGGHPRNCRQGGPLWRGQQDGSGQREKPSRGSRQQTQEEEMQTRCQQTLLQTFQLQLACLQRQQTPF
jgi:hypothetical protein